MKSSVAHDAPNDNWAEDEWRDSVALASGIQRGEIIMLSLSQAQAVAKELRERGAVVSRTL